MADASFERVGMTCLPVLHEFNADHEATLTNVTHMNQRGQWTQQAGEQFGLSSDLGESLSTRKISICERHGTAERIARVAMSMKEGLPVFIST